MNIHGKFLTFAEAALVEWLSTCTDWLDTYREYNNKDEFYQENYDEFVLVTFNSDTIVGMTSVRRHSRLTTSKHFYRRTQTIVSTKRNMWTSLSRRLTVFTTYS